MDNVVILGGGESGTGAALLANSKGFNVFLSDSGKLKDNFKKELSEAKISFEEGLHTESSILNADLVIKSPGISSDIPIIQELKSRTIPIISEIEFASRYCSGKIIAITGTDGKTTTTSLIHNILSKAGLKVGLGGNIGKSFARIVLEFPFEFFVVEVSSFQLDDSPCFHPNIAIVTNIAPDHLDRYHYNFDEYIRSKFSIAKNMVKGDSFIFSADNEITTSHLHYIQGSPDLYSFTLKSEERSGAWVSGNQFFVKTSINPNIKPFIMNLSDLTLSGKHNAGNAMAAAIAADVLEIRKDIIRESLSNFSNIEHRLENCGKIGGIEFINDSKATNVNACWYALESQENPVVWIAGGVDKGNDYTKLKPLVKEKVKIIICVGLDNRKIHEAFSSDVDLIINTTSMFEAVNAAYQMATKGDTVLLSPACASFDLFENYEDRGRQFKKSVRNL